jgi:hypothetical protein
MTDLDIPDIARKATLHALDDLIHDRTGHYELIDSHGDQDATAQLDEGQWDSAADKLRDELSAIRDRLETPPTDPAATVAALLRDMAPEPAPALIWSNQRGMWWRPARRGYTAHIAEAGRYPFAEARRIVADATCDGQLIRDWTDPATDVVYRELDEVIVPAPEVAA